MVGYGWNVVLPNEETRVLSSSILLLRHYRFSSLSSSWPIFTCAAKNLKKRRKCISYGDCNRTHLDDYWASTHTSSSLERVEQPFSTRPWVE
ncbi:hypothetical protein SUGI_0505080 [Cryptomeria japonica]|nr:hypothetical protein SUGI_0505080 [Cryptomeria japonica]